MSASFDDLVAQQGWNLDSQISILRAFITEDDLDEALDEFAQHRADLENSDPGMGYSYSPGQGRPISDDYDDTDHHGED